MVSVYGFSQKLYILQLFDKQRITHITMYSFKTHYTCLIDWKSTCTEKACMVCIVLLIIAYVQYTPYAFPLYNLHINYTYYTLI